MLRELFRPVVRFVFWNRWRPVAVLAVILVATVAVSIATDGTGRQARQRIADRARPAAAQAFTPPATPAASPSPTATPGGAAAAVGAQFASAWVDRAPGWAERLRPYATAGLEAQLATTQPAAVPDIAVTGPATVTSQTPTTVRISVPTNAGVVVLTVDQSGGRWLVAAVTLDRTR